MLEEDEIREEFYNKVSKEFEDFRNEQLKENKEVIFDEAYKISIITYFTEMCDPNCGCFTLEQIKALSKEKYPIHTLYDYYIKSDDGSYNDLYETVNYRLEALVSRNNEEQNKKSIDTCAR